MKAGGVGNPNRYQRRKKEVWFQPSIQPKPSNGSGLGWVNPGHSLGWVGFLGLGSGLSFVGLGRVEVGQTRVTQRTHLISVSFVLL